MDDTTPEPLPAWERDLLGLPVTEKERAQLDRQAAEAAEKETARRAAWPMFHDIPDGGAVDLNNVWFRMEPERWDLDGAAVVALLADRAGGVAKRLHAGVQSLLARRDGNTSVWINPRPDEGWIEVIAWSLGGCWRPERAWWVRCTMEVTSDEYGEVLMTPYWGVQFAVCGAGGVTVFQEDENGILGRIVGRWYLGWLGRRGIREQLGHEPYGPVAELATMEHFLAQVSERRQP
ncbi:hypothetical protein ACQP2T_61610 [Nonomuraea sp. CA-143628]|uniref:hypothetical protein n=1 Tax=Nonomuraea sp. CA-143628 TaxID=3239997 RepID=UPI003D90FD2A